MDWRTEFLRKVDAYCEASGRARSGVGKIILNDPKFFEEIQEGRSCSVDTKDKVEKWLDENMPEPVPSKSPPLRKPSRKDARQ